MANDDRDRPQKVIISFGEHRAGPAEYLVMAVFAACVVCFSLRGFGFLQGP